MNYKKKKLYIVQMYHKATVLKIVAIIIRKDHKPEVLTIELEMHTRPRK
jgi:hypothetical protein